MHNEKIQAGIIAKIKNLLFETCFFMITNVIYDNMVGMQNNITKHPIT